MDKKNAEELLKSISPHTRLHAARYFSRFASSQDAEILRHALGKEKIPWIREALRKAIDLSSTASFLGDARPKSEVTMSEQSNEISDEIYAEATQEISRSFVHELEPILGKMRLYAEKEIPDYSCSRTKQELDRLESLLVAIDSLNRAASSPVMTEIDLAATLEIMIDSQATGAVKIEKIGPAPLVALCDRALIEIAVSNGLRNAVEATSTVDTLPRKGVVVTWGETERDYWISIIDNGCGLPRGLDRVFDIGSSTKTGHLGMGLALARRAARSLRGDVTLSPRSEGGARYEIRWPKTGSSLT